MDARDTSYSAFFFRLKIIRHPQNYLNMNVALDNKRVIAQLRLSGVYFERIITKGNCYKLELDNNCSICNLQEPETLIHF